MAEVAGIVLAAILLASGVLKLRDSAWPSAARQLGVPGVLVPLVAPAELVLGGLLVGLQPYDLGINVVSWAAFGVLVLMSLVLLGVLRKPVDERPRCACFGRWSKRPVTWWSLVRNLVFVGLAVVSAVA